MILHTFQATLSGWINFYFPYAQAHPRAHMIWWISPTYYRTLWSCCSWACISAWLRLPTYTAVISERLLTSQSDLGARSDSLTSTHVTWTIALYVHQRWHHPSPISRQYAPVATLTIRWWCHSYHIVHSWNISGEWWCDHKKFQGGTCSVVTKQTPPGAIDISIGQVYKPVVCMVLGFCGLISVSTSSKLWSLVRIELSY